MTPHEKAVNAVNRRLERLQANLRAAEVETAGRFVFQALVVTVGAGEALNDFLKQVGEYAKRRHAELTPANETLAAQHAELLKAGKILLEQFKANPTDRDLRKQIDAAQQNMAAIQKTLRRGANALQRGVAPGIAMIDTMAESVQRFSEAEDNDALKRVLKSVVAQVRELYRAQPGLPAKDVIDADTWEKSAVAELNQSAGFHDAFARAGSHVILGLELMALAMGERPPGSAQEAATRANEAVTTRLKTATARFTSP